MAQQRHLLETASNPSGSNLIRITYIFTADSKHQLKRETLSASILWRHPVDAGAHSDILPVESRANASSWGDEGGCGPAVARLRNASYLQVYTVKNFTVK